MLLTKSIVAIVPARSGSKGFVDKNIAKLEGRTLIEHAVEVGLASKLVEKVYISTDSQKYESIGCQAGAESIGLRPRHLSDDTAKSVDIIRYMLNSPSLDAVSHVVLLQPTSPLRTPEQVDTAVRMAVDSGESVISVAEIDEPHPFKLKKIENGVLAPFIAMTDSELPRQKLQKAFRLTGAIYVSSRDTIMARASLFSQNPLPLLIDRFVNIDTELDLKWLQFLIDTNDVNL